MNSLPSSKNRPKNRPASAAQDLPNSSKDDPTNASPNASKCDREQGAQKEGAFHPTPPNENQKLVEDLQAALAQVQNLMAQFFVTMQEKNNENTYAAMAENNENWLNFFQASSGDPQKLLKIQQNFWQSQFSLWQNMAQSWAGEIVEPVTKTDPADRRFRHESWGHSVFDFIRQSYLITAEWFRESVENMSDAMEEKTRDKIRFSARQFADALSPANFFFTNPQVLQATIESKGQNLTQGLTNLLCDMERGKGRLAIRHTNPGKFKLGVNIATTPGKVVMRTPLIELIQYAPAQEKVYRRPLLIFPPWINKYYILDLQAKNSFVLWCVEQGYTVFMVSWVNPDEKYAAYDWRRYLEEGVYAAIDAVCEITQEKKISTIGYCIGGTLLSSALALMAEKKDRRVANATFFAAQTDFRDAGELKLFTDENQIARLEKTMAENGGYLDGAEMTETFNMLRANDLIWSFVVNNYLLGKDPKDFDLLKWNSDATRMPAKMHSQYLRDCYLHNKLAKGEMEIGGQKICLKKIKIPIYAVASSEDHIAPAKSVYRSVQHFGGPVRYILAGSGHIGGIINPPIAGKYNYRINDCDQLAENYDQWLEKTKDYPGSWWPDWHNWLAPKSGAKINALTPGKKTKALCDAPGEYVKITY